ncbi:IclR family transcriptional regulator [Amycolatopsis sp. lyj-90]|uniref:IclR family transcriptional regulator n=1 Tax=Amycolatopsis sp. lyj-90 TaxID=2789285 RepID=UPI00397D1E87
MRNRPAYAIESVDNALLLATLLQQEKSLGVSEAAERIGVSASTAHRLLAMLVYREFAEQDSLRRYRAGKLLRPTKVAETPAATLRRAAMPHLRRLVDSVRETANLMILGGTEVHLVATVECDRLLRVSDRAGRSMPAHISSGGKAILAALPPGLLRERYERVDPGLPGEFERELSLVRKRGFAINDQRTEDGLTAIGTVLRHPEDGPVAALALAMPTTRFQRDRLSAWTEAMFGTVRAIEDDLQSK